jgi:hypothetical protein
MKVVFFETTNASPHLETSFELATKHLVNNDDVFYYFLGQSLDYSEFVFRSNPFLVPSCLPERKGSAILKSDRFHFFSLEKEIMIRDLALPVFPELESLRSYRYKNYNAGLSALSSLISHTGHSRPCLKKHQKLLQKILLSGISTYEYCVKVIHREKPDLVYLFNGRFANNRAILDAAIELNVDFRVHERGAEKTRYTANNFLPHDFEKVKESIANTWVRRGENGFDVAKEFFTHGRAGIDWGWTSYVQQQQRDYINIENPGSKRLIAYFSSSDDEYAAVGDMVKWDSWPDQLSAVKSLIDIVHRQPSLELVIRIHPHLAKKHPDDLKDWLDLDLPQNAKLVLPSDPTDSYKLIDEADVVVTAGSTVGIEAVFWGTPSICLGPSLYSQLNAVHLPRDDGELADMLLKQDLTVVPENALPYGYYIATFGESFSYYEPETLFRGRFMGVDLQRSGLCGFARRGLSFTKRLMLAGRKRIKHFIGALN